MPSGTIRLCSCLSAIGNRADSPATSADPSVALLSHPSVARRAASAANARINDRARPAGAVCGQRPAPNVVVVDGQAVYTSSALAPSSARAWRDAVPPGTTPCATPGAILRPSPKMLLTAPPTTANCQRASRHTLYVNGRCDPSPPQRAAAASAHNGGWARRACVAGLTGRNTQMRKEGFRGAVKQAPAHVHAK